MSQQNSMKKYAIRVEMFLGDSETEVESGCLTSKRKFISRKGRNTLLGRGCCNTTREKEEYELASYLDEGSCDEEEGYQSISERDEES